MYCANMYYYHEDHWNPDHPLVAKFNVFLGVHVGMEYKYKMIFL